MVLCHVSWAPLAFTWKSGWTFWPSECCCVLQDLHMGSSYMIIWWVSRFIQCMPFNLFGLYSFVVTFAQTSECSRSALNCVQERVVDLQLQTHSSMRFVWYCTIPNLIRVHLWLVRTRSSLLLCLLTFHLL